MAWIILGARATEWHAPDWIVRNAFEFLIPALRSAGDDVLAEHCRTHFARAGRVIDLADVLADERTSATWQRAVAIATHAAAAESAAAWNEPTRQPELLAAIARLASLATGGGNALVVDLVRKKFSTTP